MGSVGIMNELNIAGRQYKYTTYYEFKDGALYRNTNGGSFLDSKRPYRLAGNYNLYVDSFPRASLPYSKYRIADKLTGRVYEAEVTSYGTEREAIRQLVEELKRR